MIQLTDAQVLAAAAPDRLVNIISAPGSGKTTIAAERYGYLRYQASDLRGVLGLTVLPREVVNAVGGVWPSRAVWGRWWL